MLSRSTKSWTDGLRTSVAAGISMSKEHTGVREPDRGALWRRISGIGVGPSREQAIVINKLL